MDSRSSALAVRALNSAYEIKMAIATHDLPAVLTAQSCNPKVIRRDRFTDLFQFEVDGRVVMRRGLGNVEDPTIGNKAL